MRRGPLPMRRGPLPMRRGSLAMRRSPLACWPSAIERSITRDGTFAFATWWTDRKKRGCMGSHGTFSRRVPARASGGRAQGDGAGARRADRGCRRVWSIGRRLVEFRFSCVGWRCSWRFGESNDGTCTSVLTCFSSSLLRRAVVVEKQAIAWPRAGLVRRFGVEDGVAGDRARDRRARGRFGGQNSAW